MIKNFFLVLAILGGLVGASSYPAPQAAQAQSSDPVFVGAGDISNCSGNNDEATAKLLDNIAGTVFTLGDNVYPDGTAGQFSDCYGPTWGRHKDRTRPVPGNHDYHTANASGYYNYFGSVAGDSGKGYYSYNLGAWHIIALNSEAGYQAGSVQEQWLRADLAANNNVCTLAYFHHPRFSSGNHGNSNRGQAFWQALYDHGADVVLSGHDHTYERFAPQNPSGQADANRGIREFVVGTGGAGLYPFPDIQPNSQVRNNTTFGVLKLTLHASSYDWQFVPVAGQTFTDSGTANCVGATGTNPTPTRTQPAAPTATRTATVAPATIPPTSVGVGTQTPIVPATATSGSISTTIPNTQVPRTAVPEIGDPADRIFADSFESGDLSAWTSDSTDEGDLTVSAEAALSGSRGLRAVIDDLNSVYVRDDSPNAEPRYRARFHFDPNSIAMASGNTHFIFKGFMGTTQEVVQMEFRLSSSVYQVRASLLNDASVWTYTNWFALSDAAHSIEFDWRASTSRGANNGGLGVWIDGAQQIDMPGIDNDTLRVDRIRLGALSGLDSSTRGTYYFDAFESRRQTYIGPAGGAPPVQPPSPTAILPTLAFTATQLSGTNLTPSATAIAPTSGSTMVPTAGSTAAPTQTFIPQPGTSDVISVDNFDSGNFTAWTSNSNDGGDLSFSPAAALAGGLGLQAVVDDANSLYVSDDHPNSETRYRARFHFDPNSMAMGNGEAFNILHGFVGTNTAVMRVEFAISSNVYVLRGSVLDDSGAWVRTNWFPISDAPHSIEVDWRAKTTSANNGGLALWIDGAQQFDLTGVDNDTRRIDRVRLGAVSGIDSRTSGTIFLDAFESRRLTYIGPATGAPASTSTSLPAASPTPVVGASATPQAPSATAISVTSPAFTATTMPTAVNTSTAVPTSRTPQSPTVTAPAGSVRVAYNASNEDIANPERGFMKQSSIFPDEPLDTNKIRALQPTDTLVWIYFRLDNYRDRSLDQTALNNITAVFNTARSKGLKLVIRFVYNPGPGSTSDPNQANPDAPIELVLQHIRTLQPILVANADVIAVMQVGFVGHWGEWHSSKYLHPLTYRKAIVDALLDALPADRMIQLRYPRYKEIFFQGPLTSQEAFTGTDRSRVGHHNDCFLRDQDDAGTYKSTTPQEPKHISTYCSNNDISCWKNFVAQESQFTPVGGETCQHNPPRTECPNTLLEMDMLHWSFINNGYRPEVLNGWTSGGCMNTIRRSLGYRLTLKEAFIPSSLRPGGALSLNIRLSNDGFAAMFNPRPLFVVLQGPGGRYEIPVTGVDPRRWAPGEEKTFTIGVNLPANVAPGTYKLGLWLPDAYTSLRGNPAYSVRFANNNTWDAATGINILTTNFQVVP